jgi:Xaa-Pro aminopeptidase
MSIAAASDFSRIRAVLPDIQAALRDNGLDGWLLYDLHARNGVSASLLGLGDLTRRYFVLLPAEGTPIAVTHGIEQGPWAAWPWDRVDYVSWKSLDERLLALLAGRPRVAMEYSGRDAVPACDLVPAGIIELVRSAGGDPQFSGDLISRFHSRWTGRQLASHRRAAQVLAETARKMFEAIASDLSAGRKVTEGIVTDRVNAELAAGGCATGADCIVATGLNAANPHYGPMVAPRSAWVTSSCSTCGRRNRRP